MKKYTALILATGLLMGTAYFVPQTAAGRLLTVELTAPVIGEFTEDIAVSGIVEETSSREVTVNLPLIPREVLVSIGDAVAAGDVIATVDAQATRSALYRLVESVSAVPEEYKEYITAIGSLGLDEALLDQALPQTITAPASGIITSLELSPGTLAAPQSAVCTISRLENLRIRMSVAEADADRVEEGDPVVFRATATGQQLYAGRVSRVFPAASQTIAGLSQQTVVGLYVTPEEAADRLKPGYSVTGVIRKGEGEKRLVIPYEAVRR